MADITTERTIAIVADIRFNEDFYPCDSGIEIDQAQQDIRSAGGTPVVFYREGHHRQHVVNIAASPATANVVQADQIHGGVRLG